MSNKEKNTEEKLPVVTISAIILLVFVLDQLTKYVATRELSALYPTEIIPGFFSLTFVQNKGAAFGMFAGLPTPWREISLGVVSLIALGFVLNMLLREVRHSPLPRLALCLILGGALGNLVDRVRYGAVVDFLDFYVGDQHWPAFNVADSSICLGVILLLFTLTKTEKTKHNSLSTPDGVAKDTLKIVNSK